MVASTHGSPCFATHPPPTHEEITASLWSACHGGQHAAAAYLLGRGADVNWIGWDDLTPLDVAQQSGADELVAWLRTMGAQSASELT